MYFAISATLCLISELVFVICAVMCGLLIAVQSSVLFTVLSFLICAVCYTVFFVYVVLRAVLCVMCDL